MISCWFHGWATDSRVFGPLRRELPERLARGMWTPDLAALLDPGRPDSWGCDLAGWLVREAPGDRPLLLAGWSLGALLALQVAAALGTRVCGLVLLSGCARFVRDADNPEGQDSRVLKLMQRHLESASGQVVDNFLLGMFDSHDRVRRDSFRRDLLPHYLEQRPAWLSAGLEYLRAVDCRSTLRRLDIPALVLHGGRDSIIHPALGARLAGGLPRARLVTWPGGDHVSFWGAEKQLAGLLRKFIGEIERSRGE